MASQPIETHVSHADLDALAAALAERLHPQNGSPWMNTAEAAEYMRVSVRWLRQHLLPGAAQQGRGPVVLQPHRAGHLADREAAAARPVEVSSPHVAGLYVAGTGSFALEVVEYARASGHERGRAGRARRLEPDRRRGPRPAGGRARRGAGDGGARARRRPARRSGRAWPSTAGGRPRVVHPAAHVSPSAQLGEGCARRAGRRGRRGRRARPAGARRPRRARRPPHAHRRRRRAQPRRERRRQRPGRRRRGARDGRDRRQRDRGRSPARSSRPARLSSGRSSRRRACRACPHASSPRVIRRRLAHALDRRFESLHHRVEQLADDVERLREERASAGRPAARRAADADAEAAGRARRREQATARRRPRRPGVRARVRGAGAARDGDPADPRARRSSCARARCRPCSPRRTRSSRCS